MKTLSFIGVFVLCIAGCGTIEIDKKPQIQEVSYYDIFNPPDSSLRISDSGIDEKNIDRELIEQAMADAKSEGINLVFYRAIKVPALEKIFYIFEVERYSDLFIVYVTNLDQKEFFKKFRFSNT